MNTTMKKILSSAMQSFFVDRCCGRGRQAQRRETSSRWCFHRHWKSGFSSLCAVHSPPRLGPFAQCRRYDPRWKSVGMTQQIFAVAKPLWAAQCVLALTTGCLLCWQRYCQRAPLASVKDLCVCVLHLHHEPHACQHIGGKVRMVRIWQDRGPLSLSQLTSPCTSCKVFSSPLPGNLAFT